MSKELSLSEVKNIELGIIDWIDSFCKENGLRYYITYGSLLGAIRHHGFIPWDDDIDIIMPRTDYKKFTELMKNQTGRYQFLCSKLNREYIYPFGKVVDTYTVLEEKDSAMKGFGLFVDVFPADGLPKVEKKATRFQNFMWTLKSFWGYSISNKKNDFKGINKLKFIFSKMIGCKRIIKLMNSFGSKYEFDESEYVCNLMSTPQKYRRIPRYVFDNSILVEFENRKFNAPLEYDIYLKALYGDYMILPPEEKRITNHSFKAWLNEEINKRVDI